MEVFDRAIVDKMEEKHPQMTGAFKAIQNDQYLLFCKKQMDYGSGNISVGTNLETDEEIKLSLTGIWFRLNDKIQRIKNLLLVNDAPTNNESVEDSFLDASNYGIMAMIVKSGKWGK
tara:strand:- start:203 stop:553 length:351 start_codon:yes stop_codon:yes gene_type:complete